MGYHPTQRNGGGEVAIRRQDLSGRPTEEVNSDDVSLSWQPDVVDRATPEQERPTPGLLSELAAGRSATKKSEGGAVVSVLGQGPDGLHREVTGAFPLECDEALDIVGLDPRCPTIFVAEARGVRLEDVGAADGVYVKISGPVPLSAGEAFLLGTTVMRYEAATRASSTAWGSLLRYRDDGWPLESHEVSGLGVTIGRTRGDVVLRHDPFLSAQHCRIVGDATGVYLDDLQSDNGTFRAVRPGERLAYGAIIRLGNTTLRVDPVA